jgi:hypothetical protein
MGLQAVSFEFSLLCLAGIPYGREINHLEDVKNPPKSRCVPLRFLARSAVKGFGRGKRAGGMQTERASFI